MMQPDGTAVFVDIEKMLYGAPAIDLAHATVYTSTMWDADVAAALNDDEVAAFYAVYFDALPRTLGDRIRPWCGPCAGLPGFGRRRGAPNGGWSRKTGRHGRQRSTIPYTSRPSGNVDDYFDPETIACIRAGLIPERRYRVSCYPTLTELFSLYSTDNSQRPWNSTFSLP